MQKDELVATELAIALHVCHWLSRQALMLRREVELLAEWGLPHVETRVEHGWSRSLRGAHLSRFERSLQVLLVEGGS